MKAYWAGIWATRYFWWNLAMSDLRARWRRSFFGMLWSILQPLGLTLLLAVVFSRMFHIDITTYAPYILSGIVFWEFISTSLMGGSLSFVQSEPYIKQCKNPLAIYPLRIVLCALVIFMLATIPLFAWTLVVLPENFGWCWLAVLTMYPLLILLGWPLATLMAYIATRFRDLPHALGLILQALWFISPVYFKADMFRSGGMNALIDYNPIYHILQIMRAPLMDGVWPTSTNYLYFICTIIVSTALACLIGRTAEKKVIFYL